MHFNPDIDYYAILGVHPEAEDIVIKAAYRAMSKQYHPDMGLGNTQKMQAINEAYQVLIDPICRSDYDRMRTLFSAQDQQDTESDEGKKGKKGKKRKKALVNQALHQHLTVGGRAAGLNQPVGRKRAGSRPVGPNQAAQHKTTGRSPAPLLKKSVRRSSFRPGCPACMFLPKPLPWASLY